MEPDDVYAVEPGVYTDTDGCRYSDTVAITEDGTERLTYFSRDPESNVVR